MGGLHFQYMVDPLGVAYPVLRLKADYLDGIRFDHATLQHIFFNSPFHLNSKWSLDFYISASFQLDSNRIPTHGQKQSLSRPSRRRLNDDMCLEEPFFIHQAREASKQPQVRRLQGPLWVDAFPVVQHAASVVQHGSPSQGLWHRPTAMACWATWVSEARRFQGDPWCSPFHRHLVHRHPKKRGQSIA